MLKKYLRKKVRDWCDKAYPSKLEMHHNKQLRPLINNRCQMNATACVANGDAVAVVECVVIDDDTCSLHYINLDDQGRYFDATLGYEYLRSDYRMIRIYPNLPVFSGDHLTDEKRRICKDALGFIGKMHDPIELL